MRIARLLLFLTALVPLRAAAQPVVGVVVEEGTGTPVPGAMVILYDGSGTLVDRVLSNATGRFVMRAEVAGPHYITVERIGYANWTTDPFEPEAGAELMVIQVPVEAIRLAGLDISSGRRCEVRPEEGMATARVWEEVRKALSVEEYTRQTGLYRYTLARYERTLDRDAEEVLREDTTIAENLAAAFVSVPVEFLATDGFVQAFEDSTTVYFAPDAGALTSNAFLDSHCFGLREGEDGRIGLVFRPIEGREVPEIGGVLWVNAETSELERIEFVYLNLIRSSEVGEPGGEVAFTRLPNGAWIVREWRIRMPHLAEGRGGLIWRSAYREEGGVTWAITDHRNRTILHANTATVSGVVTAPSGTGAPPEPVVVEVVRSPARAMTEEDGSFLVSGLREGPHVLRVQRPLLASWGIAPPHEVVADGRAGEVTHVRLRTPTVADALEAACGRAPRPGGRVPFLGRITSTDGTPRDAMTVEARWPRATGYRAAPLASPRGAEDTEDLLWTLGREGAFATARTTTDWRGLFMLCDVPPGSRLRLSVAGPEEDDWPFSETLVVPPGLPAVVESLVVPTAEDRMSTTVVTMETAVDTAAPDAVADATPDAPGPATDEPAADTTMYHVTLHVRDVEDDTPLLGALVDVSDHPRPYVSGMNGLVTLEVRAGRHTFTANKGGYTTLYGSFRVAGDGDLRVPMRELDDVDASIPGRLVVLVSESGSGRLIQGASVAMQTEGARLSDGRGSVEFRDVSGPVVGITVEGFGYSPHSQLVALNEGAATVVEVALAIDALVIDPLEVEVEAGFLEKMGVLWRLERDWADSILDRDVLIAEGKPNLAYAFRKLPGVMIGFKGPLTVLRSYGGDCELAVFLDGRPVGTNFVGLAFSDIPPESVEMAEFYQAGRSPGRFGGSPCGTVLMWSRVHFGPEDPPPPPPPSSDRDFAARSSSMARDRPVAISPAGTATMPIASSSTTNVQILPPSVIG